MEGRVLKWGSNGNGSVVSPLSGAYFCFFQDCTFKVFPPDEKILAGADLLDPLYMYSHVESILWEKTV